MRRISRPVQISEIAQAIGRSTDTLKRWEDEGLLVPARDRRGRRVYGYGDLDRARALAAIGIRGPVVAMKMAIVLEELEPRQLTLLS